jgi:hypothetical protein
MNIPGVTVPLLQAQLKLWQRRLVYNHARFVHHSAAGHTKLAAEFHEKEMYDQGRIDGIRKSLAELQNGARALTLTYAHTFVGIKENPADSNSGPEIDQWEKNLGFGHVPWCGIFCGNMLMQGGVMGIDWSIASVSLTEDNAKAKKGPFRGWTTDPSGVRQGDIVELFGRGFHMELVDAVNKDGSISTVGGNTSSGVTGSQSNGGQVAARIRAATDVHGFALVRFPGEM